jgi:LysM repeat protein
MKASLLFTTLSLILTASGGFAKSELETLRSLCAEQERQIRQLEQENSNLRSDQQASSTSKPKLGGDTHSATKPSAAPTAPLTGETYTVKPGDSIDKIGRKVGMTPEQLAKTNGLKPSAIIQPGQKLKITTKSASTTVATAASKEAAVSSAAASLAKSEAKTHTVQQGETYSSISRKYKVSTEALIAANPSVKASAMRPGQVIKITGGKSTTTTISAPATPVKAAAESSPAPTAKAPEPKASALAQSAPPEAKTAEAPAPAPVVDEVPAETTHEKKFRSITIDDQTTYGEFAAKHGTDAERLNALNGLDLTTATVLAKGSELYVPATP